MKKFIRTEHEINAPVDKVWAQIAQGDGVENWLPIIKSSRIENGNRRYCEMHEGGDLEETFLISEGNKTFMYSIDKQEAFPARDIVGTMKVEALADNKSKLFWDVEMVVDSEEVFPELKQNIEHIYATSVEKLGQMG